MRPEEMITVEGVTHPVRPNHSGMTCHICRVNKSGHKVEQDADEAVVLFQDDNGAYHEMMTHPLTAYVCCKCFRHIMGDIVQCGKTSENF